MQDQNSFFLFSPTKGKLNFEDTIKEMIVYMMEDPRAHYDVVIGTDSNGGGPVEFVSALVVHRIGRGGRYFWRRYPPEKVYNLKDRIYKEAMLSLQFAQELLSRLTSFLTLFPEAQKIPYNFEIHVDIGEKGPTKEMIKEVVGMVKGSGFEVKVKPESYGASVIADRYT